MLRISILTLLLAIPYMNGVAQSCIVKGKVTDFVTGDFLPGANIHSINHIQYGVTTDSTGSFEFEGMLTDTLLISFIGYEDQKIFLDEVSNCNIDIRLKAITTSLQEIEITAERIIAEEFTIRKIQKLEIYTNPSAKADPILAVNATPSATTIDESANISLRGGSPAETGIFLNNVPINDAVRYSQLSGIGTFSVFNTALIKNVQVYPGNPPLEYGNSTSGVIALQTDEDVPKKTTSMVSATLANLGFYSTRKLTKNSSVTLFGNYQPSFFIRSLNSTALKDLKLFSSVDAGLYYIKKLKHNTVIKLFNYTLSESYEFHYPQPSYDGDFIQHKLRNLTIGNLRTHIGKTEISFNQGLSFSKADYDYGTMDIKLLLHDLYSSFNVQRLYAHAEWKTGVSYTRKIADFNGTFPTLAYAIGEQHPVSQASAHNAVSNPEVFAYYKQYLGAKWIIGGGIRKNIALKNLTNYVSFQGNLHFKPVELWHINLSAGQYHTYQLPQGENNKPLLIKSRQYSLDVNYTGTAWENSASIFYKTSNIVNTKNTVHGIELFSRYKINSHLRFELSFASLNARQRIEQKRMVSPYNIRYFLRGNIEYKFKGTWTLTTAFTFRQGSYFNPVVQSHYIDSLNVFMPVYAPQSERLPAYNIVDLSISKIFQLTQKSTAITFLSISNIANTNNVRGYTYNSDYTIRKESPFSQRTFYFGIIVNF